MHFCGERRRQEKNPCVIGKMFRASQSYDRERGHRLLIRIYVQKRLKKKKV
jgi:hypothetical protein